MEVSILLVMAWFFSLNELKGENISSSISNIAPGWHSSYFHLENNISDYFTIAMSSGAMNLENGSTQFHV